jgi:hypothetical protein
MSGKYPSCVDCAWHNKEPAICDLCYDESEFLPADEWEDDDDDIGYGDLRGGHTVEFRGGAKVIKIHRKKKLKEAA